jgi:hypothetical protein
MKTLLRAVPLKNRLSGKFEEANLFQGIDTDNLAHIEGRWRPIFEQRKMQAKSTGESLSEINAEDAHWQWGKKMIAAVQDPLIFDIFVLECAGNTQAIMLVQKGGTKCFSRHPDHPRAPLIYVDFLSTAPWNRPKLVSEPVYKGGGRILVSTAISLSFEEEMQGRIGLHSLPGAEAFYRDQISMTDLGKDNDYNGLRYFELPSSKAVQFFTHPPKK